jgi:hypothetical protein
VENLILSKKYLDLSDWHKAANMGVLTGFAETWRGLMKPPRNKGLLLGSRTNASAGDHIQQESPLTPHLFPTADGQGVTPSNVFMITE